MFRFIIHLSNLKTGFFLPYIFKLYEENYDKYLKLLKQAAANILDTYIHSNKTEKLTRSEIHSHNTRNKYFIDLPYKKRMNLKITLTTPD